MPWKTASETNLTRGRRGRGAAGLAVGVLLGLTLTGCGATIMGSGSRPLPSYGGPLAQLFNDEIEARALGLEVDTSKQDPQIADRAQEADAVVRLRVSTVTASGDPGHTRYDLGAQLVEQLAGKYPPPPKFTLRVDEASPSVDLVKKMETRLPGKTFIGYLREFVRPDGDREIHFHLGPDTKEEVVRARDASNLVRMK